jgi:predicted MPP superfamily phosphohydrolase
MHMRSIFFILVLLGIDWYAFQALRLVSQGWPLTLRWMVHIVYWMVPVLLLGSLLASQTGYSESLPKAITTLVRSFLFIAYFSKFLVAALVLADDLRRFSLWLYEKFSPTASFDYQRSRVLAGMGLVLGSIPFFSLSYGMIRNPYRYKLFRERVRIPDLPAALEGLRIVQISDIHSGSFLFREPVIAAVDLINAQKPDLVFFTGDLVNNRASEMEPYMDIFNKIRANYGVFSVLGNHDYGDYVQWPDSDAKTANLDLLKTIHRQMGWQLLLNEHRILQIKGEKVAVIGVENYSTHLRFPKYGKLAQAFKGVNTAALKLLLSHDPSHWKSQVIPDYPEIDITFSGHTHGFQFGVDIPGWFKWSPVQYVYKEWAGLYCEGNQYLYVNRGLGFLGYPGRVGILPEVTLIELTSSDEMNRS